MMSNQAKMIIITSNEDIIRQFSSQKIKDTQIIDLNNNKQTTTIENYNHSVINLTFLDELSQVENSNKRTFDSSVDNQSKSVKISKKSIDMICAICGDKAIGYNYDVLSCAPCKIFFRRNVNQNLENMRCLTGQNQCSVAYTMRRKCTRCRLERCFFVGMRKDFLRSEEEKQLRRKRLEPISSSNSEFVSQIINDDDNQTVNSTLFDMLPIEDWIIIESIRTLFVSIFGNDNEQCSCVDVSNRILALITWSQFVQQMALRFIDFFRQIDEFQNLDVDDRLILIKNNLLLLFLISKCFHYSLINDCCSFGDNAAAVKQRQLFIVCGESTGIRDMFVHLILSLVKLTKQDPIILSLLSMILIFSRGLSMNEDEPILQDSLAVHRAQSYYTKIFWNYLVNQSGEIQACVYFTQLLTLIFRIQSMTKGLREFFHVQYITSNTVDRMAPITQSVFHIS